MFNKKFFVCKDIETNDDSFNNINNFNNFISNFKKYINNVKNDISLIYNNNDNSFKEISLENNTIYLGIINSFNFNNHNIILLGNSFYKTIENLANKTTFNFLTKDEIPDFDIIFNICKQIKNNTIKFNNLSDFKNFFFPLTFLEKNRLENNVCLKYESGKLLLKEPVINLKNDKSISIQFVKDYLINPPKENMTFNNIIILNNGELLKNNNITLKKGINELNIIIKPQINLSSPLHFSTITTKTIKYFIE